MRYSRFLAKTLFCSTLCMSAMGQTQTPAPATPDPAPAAPAPWTLGAIKLSGLVDGYYSYAPNHPGSNFNLYRNFDVRANSFSLNMAKVTLEHEADPIGFKLDLGYGRAFDIFNFQDTANGFDNLRYVPQAYITIKPAQLKGLQLDFGKFYTSAGAEPTETHLNWNYSRALMYANGPYYHFGLRTAMPINKYFTAGFQLVNGWNNVEDTNSGKTIGLTTALTVGKVSWLNTYYVGPEKSKTNKGFRHFYDTVVTVAPNDKLSTYINFDYGNERLVGGGSNDWIAIGLAARYQLPKNFAVAARYEHYYDKDGFITGTAQKLNEVTLTGEYKWTKGLLTRVEYRRDWSNQFVFERGATPNASKNQNTVLIGLVAYFGI